MSKSSDWFWRFHLGLPVRSEDRETLRRIAPELFGADRDMPDAHHETFSGGDHFQNRVRRWLETEGERQFVTVRVGTCTQPDCPLKLVGRPATILSGTSRSGEGLNDGNIVVELMTVAGGWSAKAKAFFDVARKVHGGKGSVKALLVTDPYIYHDTSEEGSTGGRNRFLEYLDVFDIPKTETLTIYQPHFAKGKKGESGKMWRTAVRDHARACNYEVNFEHFKTMNNTRFHDRFYLARHRGGSLSGLFGPSMNSLNDKSFALLGELEPMSLKRLCSFIDNWS